jgi:hypothetical protein
MWWHDGWLGWWVMTPIADVAFWATVAWILVTLVRGISVHPPPSGRAKRTASRKRRSKAC